jgi:hypothetical protein
MAVAYLRDRRGIVRAVDDPQPPKYVWLPAALIIVAILVLVIGLTVTFVVELPNGLLGK